ncbi:hypothetical protein MXD81_21465, partial [Microbacteriaceae bacterium K1510]|nr:hypothetical protein [Microbacteriaceae bacterium K1510]
NFSGANLTGAMLHNTQWDETTILIGADIGGTPFAFDREQQHFFADNPKWDRMARSLAAADWMEVELWIGKDHPEDQADAVSRVAFQIFR